MKPQGEANDDGVDTEVTPSTRTVLSSSPRPPPILKGTLSYNSEQHTQTICGTWRHEDSSKVSPQPFEWICHLNNQKPSSLLPQDGEFHGTFNLAYIYVSPTGEQKEISKVIEEKRVKLVFTEIEGKPNEFHVDGEGMNQFGIFYLQGTAVPSSNSTPDGSFNIELRKWYKPKPGEAAPTAAETGSGLKHSKEFSDMEEKRPVQQKENDAAILVGTPSMLQSPNVSAAPPTVNRPIPTPSIYKDERGEIHNLKVGHKRLNILQTKKGVMRSGDIHSNTQHDFIFQGTVELWLLTESGETTRTLYTSGSYVKVPPYVPHVFHFLEDTVMAEWWEPGSFYAWFYHPYRSIVQQSFTCTKPGTMEELVPTKKNNSFIWIVAGVSLGFAAGLFVGRRQR